MSIKVSDLLAAYPEDHSDETRAAGYRLNEMMAALSQQPLPTNPFRRAWALGGLQFNVGLAYAAYWLRGCFQNADEKKRKLLDTHLRAAIKLLAEMGYLRGAVMKAGQTIANYPDIFPDEFVDTLSRLHFDAPPMHYSLLREYIRSELGGDPEEIFASFETRAFAAASLGQVHRATLKSGEKVAVKIQYPGIGKTIRSDFRSLSAAMLPLRLSRGWDDIKAKLDEVTRILELETDYEAEARTLTQARTLFHEDDGIVIPRVFPQYSTPRILTMEYIDGEHVAAFMAQNPPQELRDQFGRKIYVSQMRMDGARMLYADPHPGNFIFLEDGRLGLIDFGCVRPYSDSEWQYYRSIKVSPSRDELMEELRKAEGRSKDEPVAEEHFKLFERLYHWTQEPVLTEGPFDFGDTQKLRIGFDCLAEATRQRYTRGKPMFLFTYRCFLGVRAMLYRLRARVDARKIFKQEYNW